jgi:methyl-accepting chemotaxis protein
MKTWWNNLILQNKIVIPVLLVSALSGVATYWYFSGLYRETETNALVAKARAVVLSAESAREYTADQIRYDVFKDSRQANMNVDQVLRTVPIFSAMSVAKKKAGALGFTLKVPKFSPRNPDNQPDEYEATVLQKLEGGTVSESWEIHKATNSIRYFRPIKLTEECMRCHGDPAKSQEYWGRSDGKDITGTKMENWRVGEVHGAFEVTMSMQPIDEAATQKSIVIAGISGLSVGAIILIVMMIARMISRPLQAMEESARKIAGGDFSVHIQESESKDEVGRLTNSFRQVVQTLNRFVEEQNVMVEQCSAGVLRYRMPANVFAGRYAEMANGINSTVDAIVTPLNVAADYVERISKGDVPSTITEQYRGDFNTIKNNLNTLIDTLNGFMAAQQEMARQHDAGMISYRIPANQFSGVYSTMIQRLNDLVAAHIAVKMRVVDVISQYAIGNFAVDMDRLPGEKAKITQSIDDVRASLKAMNDEIIMLARAAVDGKLSVRGDVSKFQYTFREMVEGINNTLDAVITPTNEGVAVLKYMAEGNLTKEIVGDYKGDHATLKNAVNATLASINATLAAVIATAEQVVQGSQQVSSASQSLSQGATEQAASLEEISSSMQEIASQTKLNAENANQANQLAVLSRDSAERGSGDMSELIAAMNEINESSKNISRIIKVIDEIAFQTNLLALNAAVEAARAGRHGKGFAVVAEEVRNLAARSAKAAKETAEMIENAVRKAENGSQIAQRTADGLKEIVSGSSKVTDIVAEIAAASNEQAQGISQINLGLGQIDKVTQQNTANAEESAAAAQELTGQATNLNSMLARFDIKDAGTRYNAGFTHSPQHGHYNSNGNNGSQGRTMTNGGPARPLAPHEVINLDDDDFGKY